MNWSEPEGPRLITLLAMGVSALVAVGIVTLLGLGVRVVVLGW